MTIYLAESKEFTEEKKMLLPYVTIPPFADDCPNPNHHSSDVTM